MNTIWLGFLLYAALAIALGWKAHLRREEGVEFWTAGRNLSGASVGLSISAGFMSVSWSCVYAVQLYYWYGLGALWLITVPWLLALGGIYLLSKRYRNLQAFSQPEMVGRRFGPWGRRIVALALASVFLVWGGAEIYVAATLLAPIMALSATGMIFLISLVVAIYATLGGFRAVVATDKLQYAIVGLYILTMGWLAWEGLDRLGGGLPEPAVTGAKSGRSWTHLLAPGMVTILLTFIAYLPGWLFETDLWLRVQAARDSSAARRGVVIAAANALLFVGGIPLFIGIAALKLFPLEGGVFPTVIGYEGDAIFAALVLQFAPEWLTVLVSVGLVAAAMSTIDTCTNVMALSVGYDLLDVQGRSKGTRLSRWITVGSVAAALVFALFTESLWDIFYLSSGILTTAVAFPVAAVFLPKVSGRSVIGSSCAGYVGTVLAYFLESGGVLTVIEPEWLVDSGIGFIAWGMLAATSGFIAGKISSRSGNSPQLSRQPG